MKTILRLDESDIREVIAEKYCFGDTKKVLLFVGERSIRMLSCDETLTAEIELEDGCKHLAIEE